MASFRQGDVLLAFLVFSDGQGAKRRPVLVVHDFGDADLLVAPITSHPVRSESDVMLVQWEEAGLKLPSTVRLEKFSTIAKSCIARSLGALRPADAERVRQTLESVFQKVRG